MLIIITGLPGTGKTTLAQLLADNKIATHLNSDIIRIELDKQGQYDKASKSMIYKALIEKTKQLLSEHDDIW